MASPEVDWSRLDKTKVFLVGVPLFSAVTTGLYPLTVVKTRQMAAHDVPGGLSGSVQTATAIWRADGLRGFYRGFGTVIFGTIPGRTVYLTTLELTKAAMQGNEALIESMAPTALAGASNFVAGGAASLATQVVAVPVDVVSQRLMRMNGLTMTRLIIQQEGLRGLWRGLVPSAALYVPNSAIWWGCYGGWQSLLWLTLHPELAAPGGGGGGGGGGAPDEGQLATAGAGTGEIVAVQTAAAALAGGCSAVLTTPLDVLKTRLQVSGGGSGGGREAGSSWGGILRELLREEGVRGLWRGLAPRMASSSIFGVCMTGTYMQLKRWCAVGE
ncbi:MAG: mitochondrial substrate carrier [Monoraphidium minutum]|nr:MAG: mitochondrial substrate carrier [Monoraphidium minutum]